MEAVFRICGLALCAASVCLLMKQIKPEYAAMTSVAASVILLTYVMVVLTPIAGYLKTLTDVITGVSGEYIGIMLKALGIAVLTSITADLLRDLGESSLASKVELCAKAEIMLLSLPLVERILRICTELLAV